MNPIDQLKQKSEELVRQQQELAQQIKDLEKKKQGPWEPETVGGPERGYLVRPTGEVTGCRLSNFSYAAKNGFTYRTKDQATKAMENILFFARLVALATELNAKHEPEPGLPSHGVGHNSGKGWVITYDGPITKYLDCLFPSKAAAQEACDIMNRDGWKMPCDV